MRDNIKKILYIILLIWTVIALFIVYKKVEFPFVYEFVVSYVICLLLVGLYSLITILLNMRKLNWRTMRKILIKFIIISFAFWACNVLFTYLTKGELILVNKILSSIIASFGLTFGELIFFKKDIA
ncbi:hypothetical protein [Clostridium folliculivorans]|uniref:Uncharacterized protein n=1 Tax=Clostridium folliculivorans TaxID=2886038 RepID=A0A9W5Y208_9CLOT|nr:hypothetical protein [Clostridium folliculivorans]GKU25168.1 hypothetical protein CFOLD11_19940 [Clostridium folliculivorans]GKU31266.1 hypothetical protein CFB3_33730 [Clostridium folliculivorans]